jgi:hypothetical protein
LDLGLVVDLAMRKAQNYFFLNGQLFFLMPRQNDPCDLVAKGKARGTTGSLLKRQLLLIVSLIPVYL